MREKIHSLIEPGNKHNIQSRLYDYVMISAIFLGLIPIAFRHQDTWMIILDKISCALFIIDYVLRWICADKDSRYGKWGFLTYPFRPMAIIDLLTILPSLTLLNSAYKVFRVTRLLRILRLARIVRYYVPLQIMISVIKKEFPTLMTVFVFAIFYILITALIMFNVEDTAILPNGQPLFRTFFDSVYWATCTLTTVGYGDIYPVSSIGRFFCIISELVGVAIIALPSGVITAGYLNEIKEMKQRKKRNRNANKKQYQTNVTDDMD